MKYLGHSFEVLTSESVYDVLNKTPENEVEELLLQDKLESLVSERSNIFKDNNISEFDRYPVVFNFIQPSDKLISIIAISYE